MDQITGLTPEERQALLDVMDAFRIDQEDYLKGGGYESDYGKEWPEAAALKAATFTTLAGILRKLEYPRVAEDFDLMASDFLGSAVGPCVDCGTQCEADGSLAVLCPKCDQAGTS